MSNSPRPLHSTHRFRPSTSLPSRFTIDSHLGQTSPRSRQPSASSSSSSSTARPSVPTRTTPNTPIPRLQTVPITNPTTPTLPHPNPPTPRRTVQPRAHLRSSIMDSWSLNDPYGERFKDDTWGLHDRVNRRQVLNDLDYTISDISYIKTAVDGKVQCKSGWFEENEFSLPTIMQAPGIPTADNCYTIELAAMTSPPTEEPPKNDQTLPKIALYISTRAFELGITRSDHRVRVFIGIMPEERTLGWELRAPEWVWSHHDIHELSMTEDYVEVEVPIYDILKSQKVIDADGITFYIMVESHFTSLRENSNEFYRLKPRKYPNRATILPRDLQTTMNSHMDDPTGDVQFIVVEHQCLGEDGLMIPDHADATNRISRKRIIKAHSTILKGRSEYFRALLSGDFAESNASFGTANPLTIVIEDIPYETMYWLLQFIYSNVTSLRPDDDVRMVMAREALHKGTLRRLLNHNGPGSWEYRHIPSSNSIDDDLDNLDLEDSRTVHSVSSAGTSASHRADAQRASFNAPTASSSAKIRGQASPSIRSPSVASTASSTTIRPAITPARSIPAPIAADPKSPGEGSAPDSATSITANRSPITIPPRHFPLRLPEPDPHPHPAPAPEPASPLSMYMAAHRYQLEMLEELAMNQIMFRITPTNCLPFLLATHPYQLLHETILEWIRYRFSNIRDTEEFALAVKEVSQGVWGDEGGQALLALFKAVS